MSQILYRKLWDIKLWEVKLDEQQGATHLRYEHNFDVWDMPQPINIRGGTLFYNRGNLPKKEVAQYMGMRFCSSLPTGIQHGNLCENSTEDGMQQDIIYWNKVIHAICDSDKVFIYGAGVMGQALKKCLEDEPYHKKVSGFIVKDMEGNPASIDGIGVVDLPHALEYRDNLVLAALHERYIDGAYAELQDYGFTNVVPVTFDSDVWSDIRGNWFREQGRKAGHPYVSMESILRQDVRIYVVHNIADRQLKEKPVYYSHEIPIQAGAALAGQRICDVCDDAGENISGKNKQYCELTALYWIWKHDDSKYAGLSHYRRRFGISENQAEKLAVSDIDVVATVPVLNLIGVRGQYGHDHEGKDWEVMMGAVRELSPEYYRAACEVQSGNYYYAYNMFVARKEILDDYCAWLFPILSYCEDKIGEKEDTYQNRYPGFLAERLFTIYLRHNRQYKIAVAKKHFIPAGNGYRE